MERRRFIAASVTVTTAVLAGCGNPDDEEGDGGGYDLAGPGQPGPEANP